MRPVRAVAGLSVYTMVWFLLFLSLGMCCGAVGFTAMNHA